MTAPSVLNYRDEAASQVLVAFLNLLFNDIESEHADAIVRVKMQTLKMLKDKAFAAPICDAFHDGLMKRPMALSLMPLPERHCRDIVQICYNVACDALGPVDTDAMFGRTVDAVAPAAAKSDYPITKLL